MKSGIGAIVFDLYGTLLRIERPLLARGIPRALGVAARPWMRLVRRRLLTTTFADRDEFVAVIIDALAPDVDDETRRACSGIVDREIDSVRPVEGVVPVLRFLRARGRRLGLISNLTSLHLEPVDRFGLRELFDAVAFSCEEGVCKPEPRIYLDLCERLDAHPRDVLVVGDSRANDVRAPRRLGMRALEVGDDVATAADVGWLDLDADPPARLLGDGRPVDLGGRMRTLAGLRTVPDEDQGRHNLVVVGEALAPLTALELREGREPDGRPRNADAGGHSGSGERLRREGSDAAGAADAPAGAPVSVRVFCKRFLFPEAVWVEEFAREMLEMVGLLSCEARVVGDSEPCLLMAAAPGVKLEGDVDPPLAREIGRHCAIGYIFANADLRSRNAFVDRSGPAPVVTMLDLEHFFFHLALDVEGLDDPFDPHTFDVLAADEIEARLKHRVLSERTTRRAMRSFVVPESVRSERGRAFQAGWEEGFERARRQRRRIRDRLQERVHTRPYLIIGTHSYRRAMATIDVDEVCGRIDQDPVALFPRLAALQHRS